MKVLKQSLVIITSLLFVFAVINTPLADYATPILGLIIAFSLIFVILKKRKRGNDELFSGTNLEIGTIIAGLILAVFITGSIQSPLFFLLYFLLFGISFLFEPITIFVFILGLIAVFLQDALQNDVFSNFIKLGSLAILSPIGFFFGMEFKRREKLEQTIDEKTGKILEDADSLLNSKSRGKSKEDIEEIDEIIENTNELRKEIQ